MSVNKYKPHLWVIPEDDANRDFINGFLDHPNVLNGVVGVRAPANGWRKAWDVFEEEYVPLLRNSPFGHVVLVIDFDSDPNRAASLQSKVPVDLQDRVFVIGSFVEPEEARRQLGMNLDAIGRQLAEDCPKEQGIWQHPQFAHNQIDLARLKALVKPFLMP